MLSTNLRATSQPCDVMTPIFYIRDPTLTVPRVTIIIWSPQITAIHRRTLNYYL